MQKTNKQNLIELAENYFDYLAEHFPVMCASDEFHFMPRIFENGASMVHCRGTLMCLFC